MADKTIPDLAEVTTITENALFVVDTGTQTFKMQAENVGLFFRDTIMPAGMLAPFAGTVAPGGWLLADGSAVSRDDYVRLFTAIGTTYGIGNGSTTFNVPDLRGRVAAGKNDMGGVSSDRLGGGVTGFNGNTLGAAGGNQNYTPGGIIGGSQSIAHVHDVAHTHTFQHVHQWGHQESGLKEIHSKSTADSPSFSIAGSDDKVIRHSGDVQQGGGALFQASYVNFTGVREWYTSGVISAPSGVGSTATTSAASISNSGGMSTSTNVNGSNFSFTGTADHRVQPTIILNYIIKT